jgi:16S rRNA processing protein RimM
MRKTIDINNCTEIGFIKKPHGLQGEVFIQFLPGMEDTLENLEYAFVLTEGLPVPFFIEDVYFRGETNANIKFELINSQEKAKEFTGCKLFCENEHLIVSHNDLSLSTLVGYTIIDHSLGQLGPVLQVDDFGGNVVLTVQYLDGEIMLPLNDDFVLSIDHDSHTLIMQCPEGLLDLNNSEDDEPDV